MNIFALTMFKSVHAGKRLGDNRLLTMFTVDCWNEKHKTYTRMKLVLKQNCIGKLKNVMIPNNQYQNIKLTLTDEEAATITLYKQYYHEYSNSN